MTCTMSLADFEEKFPTEQACWDHLRKIRWGEDQYECTRCGETEHWHLVETVKRFECYECGYQSSVTAGTMFHSTNLDLKTWFRAAYLILTSKKGSTVPRMADRLDVTYKTAHNIRHKLIRAIQDRDNRLLQGLVEVDEAYIGHLDPGASGRGTDKAVVQGWVENRFEEAGRLVLCHRANASGDQLLEGVEEIVKLDQASLHTDGWAGYQPLETDENAVHHATVIGDDHDAHEVLPWIHIVYANLKRVVDGTHCQVAEEKLQGFLDLFAYRFNFRNHLEDGFLKGLRALAGSEPWTWDEMGGAVLGPVGG